MTEGRERPQVYSKHMVGRQTQEHLARFDRMLKEMMGSAEGKPGSIEGVRVIEVGEANFPSIICAAMLGELGAEVVKVEPPGGDPARKVTPHGVYTGGVGLPFLMEARNKYHVILDLEQEADREKFRILAGQADLVIDGLRPGRMDELGIGYRQLRELHGGLIYLAISPYGHFTDKAQQEQNIPDTDLTAQSASGYPSITGDPEAPEPFNFPLRAGIWAASYMSAALGVAGTLTALIYKQRTGKGQMVDVATNDAISAWQGFSLVWGFTNEMPRVRVGNFDWCLFPYGYYEAKDGYVTVAAVSDADFRGLLKILGRWDLEDDWRYLFDRLTTDVDILRELEKEIKGEIAKHTRDELLQKTLQYSAKAARDRLRGRGFPLVVKTLSPAEVLKERHWEVRGSFAEAEDPEGRKVRIPGPVPKMSESLPRVKWVRCRLGEDNDQVFEKYGLMEKNQKD